MTNEDSAIKIHVETQYLDDQSSAPQHRHLFSYTITIVNLSDQAVTLKTRHWIITDANGKISEVQGEGVVGETPRIKPNEAYRYSSGTVLETSVGVMHGKYQMVDDHGKTFDVLIAPFRLAVPGIIH
ncbi:Co2+/Mg2+ efflux protein ApaG [Shewanella sp. A3A]|uniref:Protein ApaG n=1 Tax=Shewanella electrica TaxID=515560 RepID=A0ABT2FLU9_9GAMM|nr:Co2+/Mg2+ efflux protein ApaG [Shewanella electrica]MCH1919123.1 Co2+/Mg2+ efflux protein ApaG [Shewanella ferrihydritica]MCH1924283.1 Co2+/Mg2+ efflux protein ApaG [Shewanella electrica]MCS4556186.1 Co2+/Mg2+ efflux protein ApaG [Shewanella electrica]